MKQISRNLVFVAGAVGIMGDLSAETRNDQLSWDAEFSVGIMNTADKTMDIRKKDKAAVCAIMNDGEKAQCGPTKGGDYTHIEDGWWDSSLLNLAFKKNEYISADAGLQMNLKEGDVSVRHYSLTANLGAGFLVLGNAGLPYASVLEGPDLIGFASGGVAGAAYNSGSRPRSGRRPQLMYNTGSLLGPVVMHAGLVQSSNPGLKNPGRAVAPGLEFSVKYNDGMFRGGLALHTEETFYIDNASGDLKSLKPMTLALSGGVHWGMADATVAYGTGDPVFRSGVIHRPMISKGLKDKLNSLMASVVLDFSPTSATLFYGNELASLSKKNGHTNKKGENKDVKEQADTFGLRLACDWQGARLFFEFSNTRQQYDDVVYRDRQWAGLGLHTSLKG